LDKNLSEIISALRLVLIIGLVFVHFGALPHTGEDPFSGLYQPQFMLPAFINSFFLYCFLSAVPMLSIISGYLIGNRQPGKEDILYIYKRRFKTVFIPWIIWGVIWTAIAWGLFTLGAPYGKFAFFDIGFDQSISFIFFESILGVHKDPFLIQFWFIHDLLLMILLLPILVVITRNKVIFYITISVIISLWLMGNEPPVFYNYKVVLYFIVGLYLGQSKISLLKLSLPLMFIIPVFLLLALARTIMPMWFEGAMPAEVFIEFFLRLAGALSVFSIVVSMHKNKPDIVRWLGKHSGYSFFIFASHFPLILIFKNIYTLIPFSYSASGITLVWFLSIISTVIASILSAAIIHKISRPLFLLINGQRKLN